MKNNLIFLLLFLALAACRSEPDNRGGDAAVTEQSEVTTREPAAQPQPASGTTVSKPGQKADAEPAVGARPAYSPAQSENVLTILAGNKEAKPGAAVCVPIRVKGFINLLAMQYTLAWDPAVLEFAGVDKPGLPYLDQADFGYNRVKDGLLPFVWINDALQPTTIPDESIIYEVCFQAAGKAGQSTSIRLVQQPTPFEVVNGNEELQELRPVEGKVVLQGE